MSRHPAVQLSDRPTISVVVPCFNYGHLVAGAVDSVLVQEGVEVQVLIIDDRSTDGSVEECRRVASSDHRVEVRVHDENAGFVATANEGLAWAQGDHVVILSADDLLLPGALRRAATALHEHPSVGMVYGRALYAHEGRPLPTSSGRWRSTGVWTGREWITQRCRAGHNCVSAPTAVVRRTAQDEVGGYEPACRHAHDLNMWLRLAAVGDIAHIRAHQSVYRVHSTSMSHSLAGPLVDITERRLAFDSFFAATSLPAPEPMLELARRSLARQALWRASRTVDRGGDQELVDDLIEFAMATYPDFRRLREWRGLALRRRIGPGRSLMFPPFVVTGALHNIRARAGWLLLGLRGT